MTVVAIDGPAGAGKSTVARAVARRLGFRYVDTGGMYRAVALAVIEAGVGPHDAEKIKTVIDGIEVDAGDGVVRLNGRDVTERVRAADVTAVVSRVAMDPEVRRLLVTLQRRLADATDVVMEGRDIGTAVFPGAGVKVYLTASPAERARRRWEQDADASLEEVAASIEARDRADRKRSLSPLARAPDAVEIDTTELSIDQVVDRIASLVHAGGRHE